MTLREAAEALRAAGIDYPEYDARDLFRAFGGVSGIIMQNTEIAHQAEQLEKSLKSNRGNVLINNGFNTLDTIINTVGTIYSRSR